MSNSKDEVDISLASKFCVIERFKAQWQLIVASPVLLRNLMF